MSQNLSQKQDMPVDKFKQANVLGSYAPELLTLGYQAKRKEQRLIYVMAVSMQYDDKTFSLKTKDISINGLKLFMPRTLLFTGKQVKITFDAFVEEQESFIDDSKKEYFQNITYTIVDVSHTAEKTYVSLIQKNLNDIAKSHFNQFINSNRIQYKLDAQDVLLVAKAKFIEHIYKHNMTGIPFFISREKDQGKVNLFVENIIETVKNKELVDFFSIASKKSYDYDFTAFMLPHRLAHFAKVADGNGIALLFAYWENDKLHSLCDFEFNQPEYLVDIVLKVIAHHGKVFCINYKQVKHPDKLRLKNITEKIMQDIGKKEAVNLLKKTQRYFIQLMLTDISGTFKSDSKFSDLFHAEEGKESRVKVWCENKLSYISSEKVLGYVDFDESKDLKKLNFMYIKYAMIFATYILCPLIAYP